MNSGELFPCCPLTDFTKNYLMETTNFFTGIAELDLTGDLNLTIRKDGESLTVSLIINSDQCGDNAKKLIPPLILKGSAQEIDNGFFETVTTPMQQTSALLCDMDAYLKQQEAAKAQSAMEKQKADAESKEKDAKEKKFTEAMQKADELEKEGKFKEAWVKVPEPPEYPQHREAILKRREELSKQFPPDLFNTDNPKID